MKKKIKKKLYIVGGQNGLRSGKNFAWLLICDSVLKFDYFKVNQLRINYAWYPLYYVIL